MYWCLGFSCSHPITIDRNNWNFGVNLIYNHSSGTHTHTHLTHWHFTAFHADNFVWWNVEGLGWQQPIQIIKCYIYLPCGRWCCVTLTNLSNVSWDVNILTESIQSFNRFNMIDLIDWSFKISNKRDCGSTDYYQHRNGGGQKPYVYVWCTLWDNYRFPMQVCVCTCLIGIMLLMPFNRYFR